MSKTPAPSGNRRVSTAPGPRMFRHLADLYRTHGRILRSSRPMTSVERETLAGILDRLAVESDERAAREERTIT